MRLLHLEDSTFDAELVASALVGEWPGCRIRRVATSGEFQAALEEGGFDLILSDYTIPGFDGLTALSYARSKRPDTPFIFLSGTIGEDRAVEAVKQGAIDYVLKDRPKRLVSAIRQAFALADETKRRRRMEVALRASEVRFRQITENVVELIALLDQHGRALYVNQAYRRLLGPAAPDLELDGFSALYHEDRERARQGFDRALATGETQRDEFRLQLPDGEIRLLESNTSVLQDDAGGIAGVLQVSRDVTMRREAEQRLQEQALLLDRARDAIVATDLDFRIAYWNASAERLYGWKAAEVMGCRLDALELGFDPVRFAAAHAQLLAAGEWRGEFRLSTRRREAVLVESTWSLVVEPGGRPRSILLIDTDVTERKKLETQLLRAQRMESIGTLAGGVAHDLNNVLTPIIVATDLIASRVTTEEDRQLVERMKASAHHGAALVQQLLAFARGGEAKRTRLDPGRALADLRPMIQQCLRPEIVLALESARAAWAIQADATQFKQVVVNLCINARDAIPAAGRIEISTANVRVDADLARANPGVQPGPFVRISVVDNGTGIGPEILHKIFDPFFTTKSAGKGTGLGLSMVAGILKSHGGFVQVESEPGRGAGFHLYFPALPDAPTAPPPADAPPAQQHAGEGILLIEDEPAVREALRLLLTRAGYRVWVATDGQSGVAAFQRAEAEISLVVTDMMLPDQIGVTVVRSLRQRREDLPVIAISGMMASGQFDELLSFKPPVICLAKPIMPAELFATVDRCLQAIRGSGAART